jgi:hypothetical protein
MVGSVNRKIVVQAGLGKKRDLISKITRARRTENMAQVVEYLLESTKPLNSNPVPPKKKKTQKLLNLTQQHINQIIQHNCCNLNLECPPMAYVLRVWSPEWWYWKVVKTLGGGLQQETSKLLEVCPKENHGLSSFILPHGPAMCSTSPQGQPLMGFNLQTVSQNKSFFFIH